MNSLHVVPAGHTITASIVDGSGYIRQVENPAIGRRVTNAAAAVFGPYVVPRQFTTQGALSVTIAEADFAANVPTADQKALLDNIPTADQEDASSVWNDEGALKVSTAP
jgi:hypothetical protein